MKREQIAENAEIIQLEEEDEFFKFLVDLNNSIRDQFKEDKADEIIEFAIETSDNLKQDEGSEQLIRDGWEWCEREDIIDEFADAYMRSLINVEA